jgi:hypothetical protein
MALIDRFKLDLPEFINQIVQSYNNGNGVSGATTSDDAGMFPLTYYYCYYQVLLVLVLL